MQIPFYTKGGKFDFVCDMAMPKGINVLGYILNIFHYFGGKFDFAYDMALPKGG
jgi:hypothetical protein